MIHGKTIFKSLGVVLSLITFKLKTIVYVPTLCLGVVLSLITFKRAFLTAFVNSCLGVVLSLITFKQFRLM